MDKDKDKHLHNFLHLTTPKIKLPSSENKIVDPQNSDKGKIDANTIEIIEVPSPPKNTPLLDHQMPEKQLPQKPSLEEVTSLADHNTLLINMLNDLPEIHDFFSLHKIISGKAKSVGTYAEIIKQAEGQGVSKDSLDHGFDRLSAQKYAFLQILVKSEDAHGGNILVQRNQENHLIPIQINFSHCLGHDPNDERMLPRTTRWEKWPALKEPIEEELKTFILSLNASKIIKKLKKQFIEQYKNQLPPDQLLVFETKFYHLHANLLMVQESIKLGLNFKQILALILPPIDQSSFDFVTKGVLSGGELWPARKRFASLQTSFKKAWNASIKKQTFDLKKFTTLIQNEISEVKNLSEKQLETSYFQELCYELRRGLYL